jgi:excisionase family DNA binding protein
MTAKKTACRRGLARVDPEATGFLGVCRATVYKMMAARLLPYVLIGRSRRIPWSALEDFVEKNTVGQ